MLKDLSDTVKTREQFDEELERLNLRGQWRFDEDVRRISGIDGGGIQPFLWPWETVYRVLEEACVVMPDSLLQRRNVSFMTPGLRTPNATNTLAAGVQLVMPGEIAYAHRHTMGAIRFGIAGDERLYTVVDGDKLPLCARDLVLTPSWTWHDHHNESDREGMWLDVLDVPLLMGIDQARFEPFGDATQPLHAAPELYASRRAALVRPTWEAPSARALPVRYAWSDIEPILRGYRSIEASPYDDVLLEYVDPRTGGPTLPTLSCFIQLLRAGFQGQSHRHTSSAVYHVVEGSGVTTCGSTEIAWNARDTFVVPGSITHRHHNAAATDAILFSVTDEPLLRAIGLYNEDPPRSTYLRSAPDAPANERK